MQAARLRALVQEGSGRGAASAAAEGATLLLDDARELVARSEGYGSWAELVEEATGRGP